MPNMNNRKFEFDFTSDWRRVEKLGLEGWELVAVTNEEIFDMFWMQREIINWLPVVD